MWCVCVEGGEGGVEVVNCVKIREDNKGKNFTEFNRIKARSLFHCFVLFCPVFRFPSLVAQKWPISTECRF